MKKILDRIIRVVGKNNGEQREETLKSNNVNNTRQSTDPFYKVYKGSDALASRLASERNMNREQWRIVCHISDEANLLEITIKNRVINVEILSEV